MVKHFTQIGEGPKILVKGDIDAGKHKTVSEFIFGTLGAVMRAGYNLFIKSATLNGHCINPNTTVLPDKPSEIAAIISGGPKAKY